MSALFFPSPSLFSVIPNVGVCAATAHAKLSVGTRMRAILVNADAIHDPLITAAPENDFFFKNVYRVYTLSGILQFPVYVLYRVRFQEVFREEPVVRHVIELAAIVPTVHGLEHFCRKITGFVHI